MSKAELDKHIKSELPAIITRVQAGEVAAREEFAILLLPYLRYLLSRYKNTIDDDIDSLANKVIMKLLNKIHTIDVSKSPIGFISRATTNAAIDAHRKYKANKIHNTVEYQAFRDYDVSHSLSGMSVDTVEGAENLLKDFLCEDDAEVVSKYYLHNMSLEDIAEDTGFSVEDIQHTIDYAKTNISRELI